MAVDGEASEERRRTGVGPLEVSGSAGVRQVGRRLEQMMNKRADVVVIATLRSSDVPTGGVRITLNELGASVELTDRRQHGQVAHYLEELCDRFEQLPPPSVWERLFIALRYGARLSVLSRAPLTWRRHALYGLVVVRDWVGANVPAHQHKQQALIVLLSVMLDEPAGTIRCLLRQHQFWLEYHYARRLIHLGQGRHGSQLMATFRWPEREEYLALTRNSQQARVLVTIHMGDFFGAFKYIAAHADPLRAVTSLRRDEDGGELQDLLVNNPRGHRIARHGVDQPIEIVAALRRGNHTLTALFDLTESFGETVEVMFFGQPARFVKGPAQLAIMGRAWIVPFVTYEWRGGQYIEMASLIRAECLPGESLMVASTRVTQQLVRLAERWIRDHPGQWKYLDHMLGYFNVVPGERAASAQGGGDA